MSDYLKAKLSGMGYEFPTKASLCIVFHLHQPPYGDSEYVRYYHQCYQRSYSHHLEVLDRNPEIKINLNITGVLLEQFLRWNPEIIDRIKDKLGKQVYLTGSTYSHPIIPLTIKEIGKDACKMQIEKDLGMKSRLFGVTPEIFRLPEYAVDEDTLKLLSEYFGTTIVSGNSFNSMNVWDRSKAICFDIIKLVCRDDELSNLLCGIGVFPNYFDWMRNGGTPMDIGIDFVKRIGNRSVLTDCDGESIRHWMIARETPILNKRKRDNYLSAIYSELIKENIPTLFLPDFVDSKEEINYCGKVPLTSYDNGIGLWYSTEEHKRILGEMKNVWSMFKTFRPEDRNLDKALEIALKSQTSCWLWADTHGHPKWWKEQTEEQGKRLEELANELVSIR